tara:strand:- start:281 stop:634 length:354 start_codon:yes stop_codon:yes gene_type:complete
MPNDCWNTITIKGNEQQIKGIYNNHLLKFINMGQNKLIQRGKQAIKVIIWSAWKPDGVLLNLLKDKYPTIWIKNEWNEEGGMAGVWIYNNLHNLEQKEIREFVWNDMCLEEYDYVFK